MKTKILTFKKGLIFVIGLFLISSCENDLNDLEQATYPKNGNVFIDTFSPTLQYAAFGGSVPTAFQVDNEVTYNNSAASMRIDVPNVNNPDGSYAGGAFFTTMPRDLSGFDALTFWVKSSKSASLDVVGFGIDLGENKYQTSIGGVSLSTTWQKVIIPIPDPSKLNQEKGMFYFSEGPENGEGYSFWIDQVKFEKLGTLAYPTGRIANGSNVTQSSFNGISFQIEGISATVNLPNAINQVLSISPFYLDFTSSNPSVATVNENGQVSVLTAGTTTITASLGNNPALGSIVINSNGNFTPAPTPSQSQSNVISIFSNAYSNVPVNYYNGYWAPYQTTQSDDFTVNNNDVLNYTNFNFVGIEFTNPTVNASLMTHLHVDIFLPNAVAPGSVFKVQLVDIGADGNFGGGNDSSSTYTVPSGSIVSQNWISLNIPFSAFASLSSRSNLAQIIFEGTNITNFYADNIYFYNDGSLIPLVPSNPAPTPTHPSADVISIFSDSYTNVSGTDLNPNWGQATVTTQQSISGNNTLRMSGLNYQGIQFGSNQNVASKTFVHIDYYSSNSSALNFYLISPGPAETGVPLTVPTNPGWNSISIPLSSFTAVNLSNVFQIKFDGNGTIFVDNIYFHN